MRSRTLEDAPRRVDATRLRPVAAISHCDARQCVIAKICRTFCPLEADLVIAFLVLLGFLALRLEQKALAEYTQPPINYSGN